MNRPHNSSIINVANLKKRFGKTMALNGLSFQVNKGDIYGLLGPNGSGKSTTMRILLSLVKADEGEVRIFDMDIRKSRKPILQQIGALVERPGFYEHLSASKNLFILMKYAGLNPDVQIISNAIETVGLSGREHDKVSNYSEGMKQRLGIAQAIIHQPDIIILDEPFNSLDPQGVKDMRDLIIRLNRDNGVTILISSHKLDELEKLVNRMVLISKGKAVAEGETHHLINKENIQLRIGTDDPEYAAELIKKSGIQIDKFTIENKSLSIICNRSVIPKINSCLVRNNVQVYHLSPDKSLESFFLSFTSSE